MLRTDDSDSQFKDEWFLKNSAWTFCPTKTKNVQTNVNFGQKMSDVRPLFQALVYILYCKRVNPRTIAHRETTLAIIIGNTPSLPHDQYQ